MASRVLLSLTVLFFALALVLAEDNSDSSSSSEQAEDAPPRHEQTEESPRVRVYCQRKYPVSDEVIDNMLNNVHIPNERNATCWYGCAMRRIYLVKDGKINWTIASKMMKMKWSAPKYQEIVDKVVDLCKKQIHYSDYDDICDLAYNFAMCKKVYGDQYGLPHVTYES